MAAASNSVNSAQSNQVRQSYGFHPPLNPLTIPVNQSSTFLNRAESIPSESLAHIGNMLSQQISSLAKDKQDTPKADGYFSEVWESWGKDWEEVKTDVKKTHSYLGKQDIRSSALQQVGNVADFAVDLVGSTVSNDKTKELAHGAIDWLSQTDTYKAVSKELAEISGEAVQNVTAYLDQNPDVKKVLLEASQEGIEATQTLISKVKQTAANHPEAMRNLGAVGEIIQVAGVGKAASLGVKGAAAAIKGGQSILIKGLRHLGNGKVRVSLEGRKHVDIPEAIAYDNKGVYDPQAIKAHLETKYGKQHVNSSTIPDEPKQASSSRADVRIGDDGSKSVRVSTPAGNSKHIPYDTRVLPIFDDVAVYTTTIKKPANAASLSEKARRSAEMRAATRQLRDDIDSGKVDAGLFTQDQLNDIAKGKAEIKNLTWHHNAQSSPKNMQLVPRNIHNANEGGIPHSGEGSMNR